MISYLTVFVAAAVLVQFLRLFRVLTWLSQLTKMFVSDLIQLSYLDVCGWRSDSTIAQRLSQNIIRTMDFTPTQFIPQIEKAPALVPGFAARQHDGNAGETNLPYSEPVENLIGPEALEPVQRLVEHAELVGVDAADLLHRAHVLLVERVDDVAHLAALFGELDAHRAAVDARALVIEETHLDQLLEIVGDVGAEIVAARAQLAGGQLLVADIVQQAAPAPN